MNTTQLECFMAVANFLNFSRAAEQLRLTQPAVTHQIRTLEDELGTKLFRRTTKEVTLTQAGFQFIHDARSILSISQRAKKRLERPSAQDIVEFPIGCHSFAMISSFPQVLGGLARQFPGLRPQLRVVPFPHLYRLLEDEEVEAVVGYHLQEGKRSTVVYQEVARVPLVCICARESPLAGRTALRLEDLAGERLILNDPMRCPPVLARFQGELIQERSPAELCFCGGIDEALCLARAGLGVALSPHLLPPAGDGLAYLPLEGVSPVSFGVFHRARKSSPHGKVFLRLMREAFSSPAPGGDLPIDSADVP